MVCRNAAVYVNMDVMCYQRVPCSVFCMQSPIDYDTPGTRRPVIVQRSIVLQQESHAEPGARSVVIVNSQRGFRAHIIRKSVWRSLPVAFMLWHECG